MGGELKVGNLLGNMTPGDGRKRLDAVGLEFPT